MIFEDLPAESQDSLVTQLAQFVVELSHVSFPAIGSISLAPQPWDLPSSALSPLGLLTHPCFYVEGRIALTIDRGPFPTARAVHTGCPRGSLIPGFARRDAG